MGRRTAKASKIVRLPVRRQWEAAKVSPLHSDWNVYSRPADVDIRHGLGLLRARARELAQNSDHAKGFIRIVRNNVVGAPGYLLQSRAVTARGKPDEALRAQVEGEWAAWGRKGVCEVSGKFSWRMLQRHVIETVVRDGEAFVRLFSPSANRWGMAVQVIDPETVPIDHNGEYQGRQIRMGVEIDADRRPVAYWLRGEPTLGQSSYRMGELYRVPAEEMVHVYLPELCWQTRGVPWLATSAQRLHMIQGTEDAEVTASRASAAKFAAYEAKDFAPPPESSASSGLVDPDGNPISADQGRFAQDIAPGTMEVVPYGYELKMLDPQHPNSAMPDFLKWALRSVSTGMGVSYNTLGNDAEGVNYTSLRFFLGVERDNWMEAQDWFEADFVEPVRAFWAESARRMGTLLPRPGREDQVHAVRWQPRRWEGPDPAKQAAADQQELEIGSTTLGMICARKGLDFDEVLAQRIDEMSRIKAAAEAAGLTLGDVLPYLGKAPAPAPAAAPDPGDPNG